MELLEAAFVDGQISGEQMDTSYLWLKQHLPEGEGADSGDSEGQ